MIPDGTEARMGSLSSNAEVLAGLGVLREHKIGREKYYINDALLAELVR